MKSLNQTESTIFQFFFYYSVFPKDPLGTFSFLSDTLNLYSRLSLSRSLRDSLKYFEISVPRHIRFAELRKKINQTTTFHKRVCNLTPVKVEISLKYCGKEEKLQFLLFSTIFCYLLLNFHVENRDQILSSR